MYFLRLPICTLKMTGYWLLDLKLLLNSVVGLDRSPSPNSLCLHSLGHLPSLAHSQALIAYYTKVLSVARRSVIFKVMISSLTEYLVGHLKLVMLKTLFFPLNLKLDILCFLYTRFLIEVFLVYHLCKDCSDPCTLRALASIIRFLLATM